jgi:hypothetical protein
MTSPLAGRDFDEFRRARANAALDDEVVLPVENTPLWVLAALVIAVFGGLVFAAYYFIIKP